jgi:hypothetical protein
MMFIFSHFMSFSSSLLVVVLGLLCCNPMMDGVYGQMTYYIERAWSRPFNNMQNAIYLPGCENCVLDISLPFTFYFYHKPYTTFRLSSNGNIQFETAVTTPINGSFPSKSKSMLPIIAMYGTALSPTGPYSRMYRTEGVAPNRVFILRHNATAYSTVNGSVTFDTLLYETSNIVEIQFTQIAPSGNQSVEIGVEGKEPLKDGAPDYGEDWNFLPLSKADADYRQGSLTRFVPSPNPVSSSSIPYTPTYSSSSSPILSSSSHSTYRSSSTGTGIFNVSSSSSHSSYRSSSTGTGIFNVSSSSSHSSYRSSSTGTGIFNASSSAVRPTPSSSSLPSPFRSSSSSVRPDRSSSSSVRPDRSSSGVRPTPSSSSLPSPFRSSSSGVRPGPSSSSLPSPYRSSSSGVRPGRSSSSVRSPYRSSSSTAAHVFASSSSSSFSSNSSAPTNKNDDHAKALHIGIGITCGLICLVFVVVSIFYYYRERRRLNNSRRIENVDDSVLLTSIRHSDTPA